MLPCASLTRSSIFERKVSSPTFVVLISSTPERFIAPPVTSEPVSFATGWDSPVRRDSSTPESPSTTTPSRGILSPGLTWIIVSGFTASIGTIRVFPSETTLASRGCRVMSALTCFAALSRRWDSIYLPVRCSIRIITPIVPKEGMSSPARFIRAVTHDATALMAIRVSMFVWACARAIHAPRRVFRPPQNIAMLPATASIIPYQW